MTTTAEWSIRPELLFVRHRGHCVRRVRWWVADKR